MWDFFAVYVNKQSNALPPDNVQVDPKIGVAQRTSPTNIGLYLMSCVAANALGFISVDEMLKRMQETMDTMEQLEKWKGHLYNWYDIGTTQPLNPRYISSVDSGNLAAALLLCASSVEQGDLYLAERMRA